jgi:small conductance mechanosensitive channel
MLKRNIHFILLNVCLFLLLPPWVSLHAEENPQAESHEPVTTVDPAIPVDELKLLVQPLTTDELFVEADAWLALLKAKVTQLSQAEIEVKRKNRAIEQAESIKGAIGEAKETLEEVGEAEQTAQAVRSPAAVEDATEAATEARQAVEKVADTVEQAVEETRLKVPEKAQQMPTAATSPGDQDTKLDAALDRAARGAQDARKGARAVTETVEETVQNIQQGQPVGRVQERMATQSAVEKTQEALDTAGGAVKEVIDEVGQMGETAAVDQSKLEQAEEAAAAVVASKSDEKSEMLDITTALREERTALIDRLNVILDELNAKQGKTSTGTDNEKVIPYRLYAQSVGGLKVDVSDTEAAYVTLLGWLTSEEGGLRWAKNLGVFMVTVLAFWLLGIMLSKVVERALRLSQGTSVLLRDFAVRAIRGSAMIIGIIVGLSALEVNIGPLLAVVGAVSFAIAFALQSTLSNFASGLMIMFYKPFDVGSVINVGGLVGVVKSMSLVNTTIATFDNQVMIVPNNTIWGDIITNITGSEKRRVDLVFGISYSDDVNRAQAILEEIVSNHPLVLHEPAPLIKLDELGESSVNLICRPWAKTSDYAQVRWDIIRAVKERFDQAGISIPFPQRDVHVYNAVIPAEPNHTDSQTEKASSHHVPGGAQATVNP